METELGKIKTVHVGIGGYQDAQLGYSFTLGGKGWGVQTIFKGHWAFKRTEHAKWSEEDRVKALGETYLELGQLLKDAGVNDVSELIGKPVEVTFDGTVLDSWRILTEVL